MDDGPNLTQDPTRERRREAALKGARTRAVNRMMREQLAEWSRRAADRAEGPIDRDLIALAQSIGRAADLWSHAHRQHWPSRARGSVGPTGRRHQRFPALSADPPDSLATLAPVLPTHGQASLPTHAI